jgi:hypothetical protein
MQNQGDGEPRYKARKLWESVDGIRSQVSTLLPHHEPDVPIVVFKGNGYDHEEQSEGIDSEAVAQTVPC